MNRKEIAHLWAHQSKTHGRASNLSFDGLIMKSYNTAIAQLVDWKGERIVIHNITHYSNPTSNHQSRAMQASNHLPSIQVDGIQRGEQYLFPCSGDSASIKRWAKEVIKDSVAESVRSMEKANAARTRKDGHISRSAHWMQQALNVARWFKVPAPEADLDALVEKAKKAREVEARRAKLAQAKLEKENAQKIKDWCAGAAVSFPYGVDRVYLRAKDQPVFDENNLPKDERERVIETSKGAVVPYADARRAVRFAFAWREKGWHRNGEHCEVGNYELDSINEFGVIAGCHRIAWDEIERLAKQEGWTK
jgi:hypothetical protein